MDTQGSGASQVMGHLEPMVLQIPHSPVDAKVEGTECSRLRGRSEEAGGAGRKDGAGRGPSGLRTGHN